MSISQELCIGAKEATQISALMSETAAMLDKRIPASPDREAAISRYMSQHDAGFLTNANLEPGRVSYTCEFDCSHCLGRFLLIVGGELATLELAPECPQYESTDIIAIDTEEFLQQARAENI